jgi:recombination protein RecT
MPERTVRRTVRDAAKNTPAVVTRNDAIAQIVDRNRATLAASLPTGMNPERFARILLTASSVKPALMECDPRSFLIAAVAAAQLGLEPDDPRGLAHLVPFGKKVQLIIGYRGYIDLARRSGQVGAVHATVVYAGDDFTYSLGLEPTLHHVPDPEGDENPDDITHVYAVARVNGDPQFVVLTRRQIDKARAVSKTGHRADSPWNTHYAEMSQKTAIRRLAKLLPQTVELAAAESLEDRELTLGDLSVMAGSPSDLAADEDVIEATHTPDEPPLPDYTGDDAA